VALLDHHIAGESEQALVGTDHRWLGCREVQVCSRHHAGIAAVAPEVDAERGAGPEEVLGAAHTAQLGDVEAEAVGHACPRGARQVGLMGRERDGRSIGSQARHLVEGAARVLEPADAERLEAPAHLPGGRHRVGAVRVEAQHPRRAELAHQVGHHLQLRVHVEHAQLPLEPRHVVGRSELDAAVDHLRRRLLGTDPEGEVLGERHGLAHGPAEQLDEWQPGTPGAEVPERHLDPAEGPAILRRVRPQAEPGSRQAPTLGLVRSVDGHAAETLPHRRHRRGEVTVGRLPEADHAVAVGHLDDRGGERGEGAEREAVRRDHRHVHRGRPHGCDRRHDADAIPAGGRPPSAPPRRPFA
jgi:hypothetical protein